MTETRPLPELAKTARATYEETPLLTPLPAPKVLVLELLKTQRLVAELTETLERMMGGPKR